MKIKGKILTIAGIVMLFGYFIMESFHTPSSLDPNAVVMAGNDTLGKDWGAAADQRDREKAELQKGGGGEDGPSNLANSADIGSDNLSKATQQEPDEDPFTHAKLNQSDYTTIQAADGREIITGYSPTGEEGNSENYQTRHQLETKRVTEEPTMPYKE